MSHYFAHLLWPPYDIGQAIIKLVKHQYLLYTICTYNTPSRLGLLLQYVLVNRGTSKQRQLLQDPDGHQYTKKSRSGSQEVVYWRCVVRNKSNYCRATVIQHGDDFRCGIHAHSHPPKTGHLTARVVTMRVREKYNSSSQGRNEVHVLHFLMPDH